MTKNIRNHLTYLEQLGQSAPAGPWRVKRIEDCDYHLLSGGGELAEVWGSEEAAKFISQARLDMPVMAAAIKAALDVESPATPESDDEAENAWATGYQEGVRAAQQAMIQVIQAEQRKYNVKQRKTQQCLTCPAKIPYGTDLCGSCEMDSYHGYY